MRVIFNRFKKLSLVLTLVLFCSLFFIACSAEEEETVEESFSGVIELVEYEGEFDYSNVILKAEDQTTRASQDGHWEFVGISEGTEVKAVLDEQNSSINQEKFILEPSSIEVSKDGQNSFAVIASGGLAPFDEEIAYINGKTRVRISFAEAIGAYSSSQTLAERTTVKVDGSELEEDYNVNLYKRIEDIGEEWGDRKKVSEENLAGRDLIISIDDRIAGEVEVEIEEETLKTEDNIVHRVIKTAPLSLSDETRIEADLEDDTFNYVKEIANDKQEIRVIATKEGSDINRENATMPYSQDVYQQLATVHQRAEIIKIAGVDVAEIIEEDYNRSLEDGNEVVVKAENGKITSYTLLKDTTPRVESKVNDLKGVKHYNISQEEMVIESAASRITWHNQLSDFIDNLNLVCDYLDFDDSDDVRIVTADNYQAEKNYKFAQLPYLDVETDSFKQGEEYKLVVRDYKNDTNTYSIKTEEPRDDIKLEKVSDSTIELDNYEKNIALPSHLKDNLENVDNEARIDIINQYVREIKGAEIFGVEIEDNHIIEVIAEDESTTGSFAIDYVPVFREARVSNQNPYEIILDMSRLALSESDGGRLYPKGDTDFGDSTFKERFDVTIAGEVLSDYERDWANANSQAQIEEVNFIDSDAKINDRDYELVALKLDSKIIESDEVKISYEFADDEADINESKYFVYDMQTPGFSNRVLDNQIDAAKYERMPREIENINIDEQEIVIEFASEYDLAVNGNPKHDFSVYTYQNQTYDNQTGINHPISGDNDPQVKNVRVDDNNSNRVILELDSRIYAAEEVAVAYDANPYLDNDILTFANGDNRIVANNFGAGYGEYSNDGKSVDTFIDLIEIENAEVNLDSGNQIELEFESSNDYEIVLDSSDVSSDDLNNYFSIESDAVIGEISDISQTEDKIILELEEGIVEKQIRDTFNLTYQPKLRTDEAISEEFLTARYKDDEGNNHHNVITAQEIEVKNNVESAQYQKAIVKDNKSDIIEVSFNYRDDSNDTSGEVVIKDDVEIEKLKEAFSVEGNKISDRIDENYEILEIQLDDDNNLLIELNTDVKAIDEVSLSYDDREEILRDKRNEYLAVEAFDLTLDQDDETEDNALNQVQPLEITHAATVDYDNRDKIYVRANKNLSDIHGTTNIFDRRDNDLITSNFIVEVAGERNQVTNVAIAEGTADYDSDEYERLDLELTLTEPIEIHQDEAELTLEYQENVDTPQRLSDNQNNYLLENQFDIYNNIQLPQVELNLVEDSSSDEIQLGFTNEIDSHSQFDITIADEQITIDENELEGKSKVEFNLKEYEVSDRVIEGETVKIANANFVFAEYSYTDDIIFENKVDGPRVQDENLYLGDNRNANELDIYFKGKYEDSEGETDTTLSIFKENIDLDNYDDYQTAIEQEFSLTVNEREIDFESFNVDEANDKIAINLEKPISNLAEVELSYTNSEYLADDNNNITPRSKYRDRNYTVENRVSHREIEVDKTEIIDDGAAVRVVMEDDIDAAVLDKITDLDMGVIAADDNSRNLEDIRLENNNEIILDLQNAINAEMGNLEVYYRPTAVNNLICPAETEVVERFSASVENNLE